jgi:lambda repressor-like predicted transcriptional regulator
VPEVPAGAVDYSSLQARTKEQHIVTDAISSTSPYSINPYGFDPSGLRTTVLSAASDALGIDQQTLTGDLQGGQSLAAIAQQQGVSSSTLVSAIAQGLQSAQGTSSLSSTHATSLATDIVNRKGFGGHHHHHHHAQSATDSTDGTSTDGTDPASPFATVSSLLGMSQTDLLSALEQGTSLSSLLSQNGLSVQSVTEALGQGSLLDTTA